MSLPDVYSDNLPVVQGHGFGDAPPELAEHPVWQMLQRVRIDNEVLGNIDMGALRSSILEGWAEGLSPIRSLYTLSGVDEDLLSVIIWSVTRDMQVVSIDPESIDLDLFKSFSFLSAKQHHMLPLYRNGDGDPVVAISDLNDMDGLRLARDRLGSNVMIVLAERRAIDGCIEALESDRARIALSEDMDRIAPSMIVEEEEEDEEGDIVRIFRGLVQESMNSRVSDIHIDPNDVDARIRFRIDGVLRTNSVHSLPVHVRLTNYIKQKAKMDIAKMHVPQDGGYQIKFSNGDQIHLRVATIPTDYTYSGGRRLEKVTIRLVAANSALAELDQLGMNDDISATISSLLEKPSGMVVLCGPTNSGKTTTLYAMINRLLNDKTNIMTVEDPIEKHIKGVNQTAVHAKSGMTYAAALQSFLRHDPDVILVGEIRGDEQTVMTAINASLAGKMVLTTVHTSSVVKVPSRLISMGVEPFTLVDAIRAMVSQRLVRKLCDRCKAPIKNSGQVIDTVEWPSDQRGDPIRPDVLYKPVGCNWCRNVGYRGRMAAAEILIMDNELEALILNRATANEIKRTAQARGVLRPLSDDILIKVARGDTSLSEVSLAGGA